MREWAPCGRKGDAEGMRTLEESKRCSPDLCICPLSARTADLDAPGDGGAPGRATTAHLLVIAAFTRGGHPPKIVAGISSGPTGRAGRGHRVRGGTGDGDGVEGNPRLEPRIGPKPSLTSRQRGSMNCCERHEQDLVAPDREQSPQAGGRGGPRASSSSAAKMRDCEVPYIGDERCESLILCAYQTDRPPAATVRLPRATGWQTEDSRSIYPCGQN